MARASVLIDEVRDSFYLHNKLGELASVDVIKKDGDFIQSNNEIYEKVESDTPVA